jgi:hypothetical protein
MRERSATFVGLCISLTLAASMLAWAQLPLEPPHESGQGLTGAFEGWFSNPDGSFSLLLGYFNRNTRQELDIAIGPNNKFEPGGPDRGQPTHFLPSRQWGVFTITVPKDFGTNKLTWTLTANHKTAVIPASLDPLWELSPFVDATGNTPPFIAFDPGGPFVNGPRGQSAKLAATLGVAAPLTVWVADDAKSPLVSLRGRGPAVTVAWSKFRGPGEVTFANARPPVEKAEYKAPLETTFSGKASTSATFSEPGDYILRVVANDSTGDGGRGFQCCWSNAQVKVTVSGASARAK